MIEADDAACVLNATFACARPSAASATSAVRATRRARGAGRCVIAADVRRIPAVRERGGGGGRRSRPIALSVVEGAAYRDGYAITQLSSSKVSLTQHVLFKRHAVFLT